MRQTSRQQSNDQRNKNRKYRPYMSLLQLTVEEGTNQKNSVPKLPEAYLCQFLAPPIKHADLLRKNKLTISNMNGRSSGELETLPGIDEKRFEQVKSAQIEQYGSETPQQLHSALHFIRRQSYERQGLEYIKEGHFGLWRNTRLDIASLLDEEGKKDENKLREALATYLEVCYIDLNGPRNSTKLGRELDKRYENFEPLESDLAIGIVRMANLIIERLSLTRSEVKILFQEHNKRYLSGLNLPLSIDQAWNRLEPDLVFKNGNT